MSTEEDRIRLVMEYVGGAGADALRAKQAGLKAETLGLVAAFSRGEISEKQFADASKVLSRSEAAVEQALKASARAATELAGATDTATRAKDKLATATGKAESKLKGFGQTGLQTGRVVQDFAQGGIGGVLNNIEGFTQAIGLGPGAAGALTVLGVAAFVAKPYIVSAGESIGLFGEQSLTAKGKLEQLKKKIEELEAKPHKVSLDFSQINEGNRKIEEMEKRLAAFNAARETSASADLGHAASKAIKETVGSEALQKAVAAAKVAEGDVSGIDQKLLDTRAKAFKKMESDKRILNDPTEDPVIQAQAQDSLKRNRKIAADAQAGINQQYADQAKEEVGAFATGDIGAVAKIKGLAERHPGAFPKEFKRDLAGLASTPEQVADRKQEAKAKEENPLLIEPKAVEGRAVEQEGMVAAPALAARKRQRRVVEPDGTVRFVGAGQAEKEREKRVHGRRVAQVAETVAEREAKQAEQAKTIDSTSLDEEAAAAAADLQKQGGGEDRFGRFRKLNPDQQRNELHRRLLRELKTRFPGISKQDAEAQAGRIGGEAFGEVGRERAAVGGQVRVMAQAPAQAQPGNQAVNGAMVQNMAQAAGNQAAMVVAQGEMLRELANVNAKLNQLSRGANQNASRARTAQTNIVPY